MTSSGVESGRVRGTGRASARSVDGRLDGATSSGIYRLAQPVGATVELMATPGANSIFEGWSFDCEPTGVPHCLPRDHERPAPTGARFKTAG